MTPSSATITVSAQLGSGGHAIARAVADELGYRFYDREIILEAAQLSGVSAEAVATAESWPSFIQRMVERLTATTLSDGLMMTPMIDSGLTMRTSADYRALIAEVVKNLADEGRCVIVGHAGQVTLKDRPSVFKVLVHGSPEGRASRLASEAEIGLEEAMDRILADDGQRSKLFKCAYKTNWLSCVNYDISVNSDDVSEDVARSWILAGVESHAGLLVPA